MRINDLKSFPPKFDQSLFDIIIKVLKSKKHINVTEKLISIIEENNIKKLMELRIGVNEENILLIAVSLGLKKVVEELIKKDKEYVLDYNHTGEVALFLAIRMNQLEIIKLLINYKPQLLDSIYNIYKENVFLYSASYAHVEIMHYILKINPKLLNSLSRYKHNAFSEQISNEKLLFLLSYGINDLRVDSEKEEEWCAFMGLKNRSEFFVLIKAVGEFGRNLVLVKATSTWLDYLPREIYFRILGYKLEDEFPLVYKSYLNNPEYLDILEQRCAKTILAKSSFYSACFKEPFNNSTNYIKLLQEEIDIPLHKKALNETEKFLGKFASRVKERKTKLNERGIESIIHS